MSKPFSNFFKSICEGLLFPFCQFHKVIVLNQLALSGRKATQKHCALGPKGGSWRSRWSAWVVPVVVPVVLPVMVRC